MFEKGEFVVCGGKGVCTVENITTLNMPGVDCNREYYILKPIYSASSTVYLPVDTEDASMRRILSAEEADELIKDIPNIPLIDSISDKLLEQEYKMCMKTNRCEQWVKVLKTAARRRIVRQEMGRKITAIDAKYTKIAQDNLFGELSVVLQLPKEKVEKLVKDQVDLER